MPNANVLAHKKQVVEDLTEKLKSKAGVFVDYKGINVVDDTQLRVKMRDANVDYSVIKNSMMRFAIKNVGFDELDSILNGTTSLAVSNDDAVAPARLVKEHSDKFNEIFNIKGGFMDGKVISVDEVKALASIPPLPILQAQFLGTLLAPITTLAIVLKAAAEKGGASSVEDAAQDSEVKSADASSDAVVSDAASDESADANTVPGDEAATADEEVAAAEAPVEAAEQVASEEPVKNEPASEEPAESESASKDEE